MTFDQIFSEFGTLSVLGGIAALFLTFLALRTFKARPGEAMIITGLRWKMIDPKTGKFMWRGFRIVQQGRAFVAPFIERIDRLSLEPRMVSFTVIDAPSTDPLPINVQGVMQYKPGSTDDMIYVAAGTLLEMKAEDLNRSLQQICQQAVRTAVGRISLAEMLKERDLIGQIAEGFMQAELAKLGLIFVSLGVTDVKDGAGYMEAQTRPKAAQAKRDAAIAEIERSLEVAFKEIESKFQIERAKLLAEAAGNPLTDPQWLDKMQSELELWLSKTRRETTLRLLGSWTLVEGVGPGKEGKAALDIPVRTRDGSEIPAGTKVIPIDMKQGVMYVERV